MPLRLHTFEVKIYATGGPWRSAILSSKTYGKLANLRQYSIYPSSIGHFTVMDGSEAEGDLVLIQTFFALLWKLFLKNTSKHKNNLIYIIKQEGLYQNKVILSLASIYNCKMAYLIIQRTVMLRADLENLNRGDQDTNKPYGQYSFIG